MNSKNLSAIGYGLLFVGLLAAPMLGAYPVFVMKLMCFALFAAAFNLLLGYTGMLSFGHAAFLGGSAYVAGQSMKAWGFTPEIGLLLGTASGALLGLIVGFFAIRRTGIYSTMITLALAVVVIGFMIIVRTVHSPYGQVLKAIKENEPRAISLGYDTNRFKLLAFVLSAALSGLAGSLKTLVLGFATLSDAHWTASGHVVLMTLVGGLGTLSGPLVGSAVVVLLENKIGDLGTFLGHLSGIEWFNSLGESVTIVTGLIFVICVLAFRRGIMGELIAWMARRKAAGSSGH